MSRPFYEDVLGGIEVNPVDRDRSDGALYFLLEGQLIQVRAPVDHTDYRLELSVASPIALAERCWDAGYTVSVEGAGVDETVCVTDPLGRTIALLPRAGMDE